MRIATKSVGLRGAAVVGAALLLAGCGDDEGGAGVPADWVTHSAGPVVVHVPPAWEELDAPSAGAGTTTTFGLPDDGSMVRPGVSVTVVAAPTREAAAEAHALVTREQAPNGGEDVATREVERADASSAVEVEFWQELTSAQGPVEVSARWLVADREDGTQVLVGAVGPRADFDKLPLDEVFASVDLTGGARQ